MKNRDIMDSEVIALETGLLKRTDSYNSSDSCAGALAASAIHAAASIEESVALLSLEPSWGSPSTNNNTSTGLCTPSPKSGPKITILDRGGGSSSLNVPISGNAASSAAVQLEHNTHYEVSPPSSASSTMVYEQYAQTHHHSRFAWSSLSWNSANMNMNNQGVRVATALGAWYLMGILSICTTKILLQEWQIPPLLLTFQQLFLGSTMLRACLTLTSTGIEPWPWNVENESATTAKDFALIGLFNALDFLASNTAFSRSAASFVETIKASDPITTSMVALFWGVDRVGQAEAANLFLLIAGMLLSTVGNAEASASESNGGETVSLHDSATVAATVVTANICFAFRAMSQKLYRRQAMAPMNDASLWCRMQQIGWVTLLLPAFFCYTSEVVEAFCEPTFDTRMQYMKLALINAFGFCTYNLAGCYVLSKVTVLHYAALSCLRRLFAIVASCIVFNVPITLAGACGMITSFGGFCGFTYHRSIRHRKEEKKTTS